MATEIADEAAVEIIDPPAPPDPGSFAGIVSKFEEGMKEVRSDKTATPTAEVKSVDGKVEDKPRTEDGKWTSPKAADWKKLKTEKEEAITKAITFEGQLKEKLAEIEALRKEPKIDPKELETLKGERDKLLSQVEVVALERSERFANHYDKLFSEATKSAKEAAGADNAELVEHLMELRPSKQRKEQLDNILGTMTSESDRLALSQAVRDMDRGRADRDEQLKNSKSNLAKLRQRESEEAAEMQKRNQTLAEQAIGAVLKAADSFDAFQPVEGDEAHNAEIPKRKQFVKDFFEHKLDKKDYALVPILAKRAEHLERINANLSSELKKAQEALAGRANANPDLGGRGQPGDAGKRPGFMDVFLDNLPTKSGK